MFTGRRRRKRSSSEAEYDPDAWDKVDEGLGYFDADSVSDIIFSGMSSVASPSLPVYLISCVNRLPLPVACLFFHVTVPQPTL